jgi:hypothetical protein
MRREDWRNNHRNHSFEKSKQKNAKGTNVKLILLPIITAIVGMTSPITAKNQKINQQKFKCMEFIRKLMAPQIFGSKDMRKEIAR